MDHYNFEGHALLNISAPSLSSIEGPSGRSDDVRLLFSVDWQGGEITAVTFPSAVFPLRPNRVLLRQDNQADAPNGQIEQDNWLFTLPLILRLSSGPLSDPSQVSLTMAGKVPPPPESIKAYIVFTGAGQARAGYFNDKRIKLSLKGSLHDPFSSPS
jgi:hypothetical protein